MCACVNVSPLVTVHNRKEIAISWALRLTLATKQATSDTALGKLMISKQKPNIN